MCFATLWGEIRDFGALYLLKKSNYGKRNNQNVEPQGQESEV